MGKRLRNFKRNVIRKRNRSARRRSIGYANKRSNLRGGSSKSSNRFPIASAIYKTIGRRIRRRVKLFKKGKTIYKNEKMSMRKAGNLRGRSEL